MIRTNIIRNADAFPSSEAFDLINNALRDDDAERKDAIKKGNAVFAFTLKNNAGETSSWHIDLKESGTVGEGTGREGRKTDGELSAAPSSPSAPMGGAIYDST